MNEPLRGHPEEWPSDTRECIFLGRVLGRLSDDDVWRALRSGQLEPRVWCVGRTDFWPIPLSPVEFLGAERDQVLDRCQIDVRETDQRRPVAIRRRIPVPHWLYVTRASLDRFVKAKPAATVATEQRAAAEKSSGGHKSELARKAASAIWGNDGPPADLPPQQIFKQVADKIGELHPGVTIGKSQALRALGRK